MEVKIAARESRKHLQNTVSDRRSMGRAVKRTESLRGEASLGERGLVCV